MRFLLPLTLAALVCPSLLAQEPGADVLEINGAVNSGQIAQLSRSLNRLWLFPEEYEGKTIRLKNFLFEAENFEPYPDLGGYLFACEPVDFAHNDQARVHVGTAQHLSLDKLNLFCTDEQGKRIRRVFKDMDDARMSADVTIQVRKGKEGAYFGVVTLFTPRATSKK